MATTTAKISAVAACGIALALSLWVGAANYRSARQARLLIHLLKQEDSAVESALRGAESAAARASNSLGEAKGPPSAAVAAPTLFAMSPTLDYKKMIALVAQNPKMRPLATTAFAEYFRKTYGPFYLAINLGPNEANQLEALASKHVNAQIDIDTAAANQGLADDDAAVAASMEHEEERAQAAYRDLLGDANYRLFQSYGSPIDNVVQRLSLDAALSPTPLTGFQASQLMGILTNASSQYQAGGAATLDTVDWTAALAQARGILTPGQFAALNGEYAGVQIRQYKAQFDEQELGVRF